MLYFKRNPFNGKFDSETATEEVLKTLREVLDFPFILESFSDNLTQVFGVREFVVNEEGFTPEEWRNISGEDYHEMFDNCWHTVNSDGKVALQRDKGNLSRSYGKPELVTRCPSTKHIVYFEFWHGVSDKFIEHRGKFGLSEIENLMRRGFR